MLGRDLGPELALLGGPLDRLIPVAGDQTNLHREIVDAGHEDLTLGVESTTAPIHAAEIARKRDGPLNTRWREDALGTQLHHLGTARAPVLRGQSPGIVRSEPLRHERRRREREGLRS